MVRFIRDHLSVRYYSGSSRELKQVENSLKFYVEGAEFSPSYRQGRWDGYYRFYEKRTRSFNYGLLGVVYEHLDRHKIGYTLENDFKPLQLKHKLSKEMWTHQRAAIQRFILKPFGTIKIPTRGGKTKMTAETIRVTEPEVTLFIVDSSMLLQQAIGDISKHLNISKNKIGIIQGDEFNIKPITVAMIQTLQSIKYGVKRIKREKFSLKQLKEVRRQKRVKAAQLDNYLKQVDFLCVDEVREFTSDERIGIISSCINAKAVICLDATPEKSENPLTNIKIKSIAGEIIYEVKESELKKRGVLAKENGILILVDHTKNRNITLTEEDGYELFEEQVIVNNERRNNIITNVIQILKHLHIKTLVLFQYHKHGKLIQQVTGDELLTSKIESNTRIKLTKQFLKQKAGTLLATNIFNKGLTLPEVEVLVNAAGGKEQSIIVQKKGRTLGTTAIKKKAITIDLIDISKYFKDHSLNRVKVYEQHIGAENMIVLDSADKDFYNDIREYLSEWKQN